MNNQWEVMLPLFQYALNDSVVEPNRISPYRLVFGNHPSSPLHSMISSEFDARSDPSSPVIVDQQWVVDKVTAMEKLWSFVRDSQ